MKLLSLAGGSVHDGHLYVSDSLMGFFLHQELECLQDHLEDLVSNCREVVGNLTELESEVCFISYSSKQVDNALK